MHGPGMVLVPGRGSFLVARPFETLGEFERGDLRVVGRYAAGEQLIPGRLVALVNGVLRPATAATLGTLVGVALARRIDPVWLEGEFVQVARRGQVTVDGRLGEELTPARFLEDGTFDPRGIQMPRALFTPEGITLNL